MTSSTATVTPEPCTLSLHAALPISSLHVGRRHDSGWLPGVIHSPDWGPQEGAGMPRNPRPAWRGIGGRHVAELRSEEHTSELQSRRDLVCRLLLEKKKQLRRSLTLL